MEYGGYELIYLEPDGQLNVIVEKIEETSFSSLAFIVHDRSPLLYSSVNLDLIKKRLKESSKDAVFVTSNPQLINILTKDDWTVYNQIEELDVGLLPEEREELLLHQEEEGSFSSKDGRRGRRTLFLLLLLFIGMVSFYTIYSRIVLIEITPARKVYTQEMVFSGDFQTTTLSLEEGILPMMRIPFSKERVLEFSATGERMVGISKARGRVRFINEEEESRFIPSGTLIWSNGGVEFFTLHDLHIPGVDLEYLFDMVVERRAGWAEVEIEAREKGESGNLPAGEIREWSRGEWDLYVINPEPISGGRDQAITVVTKEDLEKGRERVEDSLLQLVKRRIQEEVRDEHLVVRDIQEEGFFEISSDKKVGEEGSLFSLTGRMEGEIIYLKKEDLEYLVAKSFSNGLSSGFKPSEDPLKIQDVYMQGSRENGYSIHLSIAGEVVAVIDREELERTFKGVSRELARETLRSMPEVEQFRITGGEQRKFPSFALGLRVIVDE